MTVPGLGRRGSRVCPTARSRTLASKHLGVRSASSAVGASSSSLSWARFERPPKIRAWYPQAVTDTIELENLGLDPTFQDAYVKYSHALSPRTILSAHALLAHDRLKYNESDGNEVVDTDNSSGYLWLRLLHSWSDRVFSDTVLSGGRLDRSRKGFSEPEDDILVVDDERTVDFVGLKHDMSWEISPRHLLKSGLEKGDAVAILSETRVEWAFCDLGILGAGGITVPIYHSNLPDEVHYILDNSEACYMLVENLDQCLSCAALLRVR